MTFREFQSGTQQAELLMDVAANLADLSHTPELARQIPAYLGGTLGLEALTVAHIRDTGDGAEIILCCSSGGIDDDPSLLQDVLAIYQQVRSSSAREMPVLRPSFESLQLNRGEACPTMLQRAAAFPRAIVFSRAIDDYHRALLIVHQRTDDPHLPALLSDTLHMITVHLAKLLGCLQVWTTLPDQLGAPFDRLTDREWMVLRGLGSDAGEKQLADQLGLSPHTLHSHIKSIYRKVGVQGRLPLLLRAEEAMRKLRGERINCRASRKEPDGHIERAIALG